MSQKRPGPVVPSVLAADFEKPRPSHEEPRSLSRNDVVAAPRPEEGTAPQAPRLSAVQQAPHPSMVQQAPRSSTPRNATPAKKSTFNKKTGRCKNHPSVIMARRSKFTKGWDIIREACPHCQETSNKSGTALNNSNREGTGGEEEFGEISKKKMTALLRGNTAASCNMLGTNHHALPSTERNTTALLRRSSTAHALANTPVHTVPPDGAPARVSRMPYTTPNGEVGWYTGEVNSATGRPHGRGRLRCKTGNQIEGEWTEGYSAEYLERRGRMQAGFGENQAPWKEGAGRATGPAPPSDRAQSPYVRAPAAYRPAPYGMTPGAAASSEYPVMGGMSAAPRSLLTDRAKSPYARDRAKSPHVRAALATHRPSPYEMASYGGVAPEYPSPGVVPAAPGMPLLASASPPSQGHYLQQPRQR